jgi:alpha-glucosidase (family GH31 glycosyl hydrolase)
MDSWDSNADFTLDTKQYPNPINMANELNTNNQRLVAYLDAAVNVQSRDKNPAYAAGKKVDGFIKTTVNQNTDGYLVNSKKGKNVVYVDWLNGQACDFWSRQVSAYQKALNFDGLWTTMNEPFGDVAGEISSNQLSHEHLLSAAVSHAKLGDGGEETPYDQSWFTSFWPLDKLSTYLLPFIPEFNNKGNYDANTLSLNATHIGNTQDYDVHSLYPLGMANATLGGISGDSRPFYLTKGSFSGISRFTGAVAHTDNERTWDSLYFGLQSTLRSQMFGMPLSGSDICGYKSAGDALDEELCLRWYQMATLFPLARHSQEAKGPRTDPFGFKDQTKASAVKKTMHDRMQYLRLLYTCLFQASDSGGPCLSPL